MSDFVIDAHALIWMLEGNARLGFRARAVLSDSASRLHIPVIALSEACWAVSKGKTSIQDWQSVLTSIAGDRRMQIAPMDETVVARALSLPSTLEMHDAQIVATTLILSDGRIAVPLLTCDRQQIVDCGLVQIVW